jgi:transglutaminase-like putative cysteine protease
MSISPLPEVLDMHTDFYGNQAYYFAVEQEHETLTVTVTSVVERSNVPSYQQISHASWESVRGQLQASTGAYLHEKQFVATTDFTLPDEVIRQYAAQSFTAGASVFNAVHHLMQRIYIDFKFTPGFTTVSTPLSIVMKERKGVCQDFAHLAISCLHAMGLPARYVSGYIETIAPPGKEKLTGVDASHAWFAVFIPDMGWVDFDPTNNKIPDEQYITVAWGRDYFDVVPLKGVIMSSSSHQLKVSVDVRRLE